MTEGGWGHVLSKEVIQSDDGIGGPFTDLVSGVPSLLILDLTLLVTRP